MTEEIPLPEVPTPEDPPPTPIDPLYDRAPPSPPADYHLRFFQFGFIQPFNEEETKLINLLRKLREDRVKSMVVTKKLRVKLKNMRSHRTHNAETFRRGDLVAWWLPGEDRRHAAPTFGTLVFKGDYNQPWKAMVLTPPSERGGMTPTGNVVRIPNRAYIEHCLPSGVAIGTDGKPLPITVIKKARRHGAH